MKKKVFCFLLSGFLLFTCACGSDGNKGNSDSNPKGGIESMFEEQVQKKLDYTSWMRFRWYHDNEPFILHDYWVMVSEGKPLFKDVVFITTEDEVGNYGRDVLLAYPGAGAEATLENLNLYVSDLAWSVYHVEVNLAEFSLDYPITMTDLTEKWENIYQLLESFPQRLRGRIQDW